MLEIAEEIAAVRRRIDVLESGGEFGRAFAATLADTLERQDGRAAIGISRASIDRAIGASAAEFGVDPRLVEAVVENESAFDPRATSGVGARGLMQLMPETARSLGVVDAYDPAQNVRGGTRYLRGLLDRFGSVELAIAAYNAGPGAVERYASVPPYAETRKYVRTVLATYRALKSRS
jgi:soluble lytic murein transglycosylase-like protein